MKTPWMNGNWANRSNSKKYRNIHMYECAIFAHNLLKRTEAENALNIQHWEKERTHWINLDALTFAVHELYLDVFICSMTIWLLVGFHFGFFDQRSTVGLWFHLMQQFHAKFGTLVNFIITCYLFGREEEMDRDYACDWSDIHNRHLPQPQRM